MQYQLSFASVTKHSDMLVEVVVDDEVVIGAAEAREVNEFSSGHFEGPYGVLIDTRNHFTFKLNGLTEIGSSANEKKMAFLTRGRVKLEVYKVVASLHNRAFPNKAISFFDDRDEALACCRTWSISDA